MQRDMVKGKGPVKDHSLPETRGDHKIFLVFERATQGPVLGFLSRYFVDFAFIECWEQTVSALSGIANGIYTLHKHQVLHR